MVIFGASGDLVARKLLPALFGLFRRGLLPERFFMLGFARTPMTDDDFRGRVRESILAAHPQGAGQLDDFLALCRYTYGDYDDPAAYTNLALCSSECVMDYHAAENLLFYLALPPEWCVICTAPVLRRKVKTAARGAELFLKNPSVTTLPRRWNLTAGCAPCCGRNRFSAWTTILARKQCSPY
jgi:glucose-6-phosphate 1-dehydrogenase